VIGAAVATAIAAPAAAAAAGGIDEMVFPFTIAHCSAGYEPLITYMDAAGDPAGGLLRTNILLTFNRHLLLHSSVCAFT
jgi:hypothetical protein